MNELRPSNSKELSMNRFEEAIRMLPHGTGFRDALIDVCDTASICRKWLLDNYDEHTAADVVVLAGLVMAQAARVEGARP